MNKLKEGQIKKETVTTSISPDLKDIAYKAFVRGGYRSFSEYIRHLIIKDNDSTQRECKCVK